MSEHWPDIHSLPLTPGSFNSSEMESRVLLERTPSSPPCAADKANKGLAS